MKLLHRPRSAHRASARFGVLTMAALIGLVGVSCTDSSQTAAGSSTNVPLTALPEAEAATRAYVYGYPLVFGLEQRERLLTTGIGNLPPTKANTFTHARDLANADSTFVGVNNDTLYSDAPVDLSVGPIRLEVPEVPDNRYYVLQFVDAWTNNFAYVGTRATGDGPGAFLLVPPGWAGSSDVPVIHFPTRVGTIVGRWQVNGPEDLPAVHGLQDGLRLLPDDPQAAVIGLPTVTTGLDPRAQFYEKLRVYSQAFPPAARDEPVQKSMAATGITREGVSPFVGASDDVLAALDAAQKAGETTVDTAIHTRAVQPWQMQLHAFDYNLDFFEIGTINTPEWRIEEPVRRFTTRAAAAKSGLWGLNGYEAAYATAEYDDKSNHLDGSDTYTLRVSPPPPVGAFWSVTMYRNDTFTFAPNELNRYSIGDRTPGLVLDPDGGLTITISKERPADVANWLPAPDGPFRLVGRFYAPGRQIIEGGWSPRPVVKG